MTNSARLEQFVDWGVALAELPNIDSKIGILVCIPTDNPAARIELECSEFIGRITLWSDGSFFVEALDIESEEHVIMRHGLVAAYANFDQEFEDILHLFRAAR